MGVSLCLSCAYTHTQTRSKGEKKTACAFTDITLVCNAEICKWVLKWTAGETSQQSSVYIWVLKDGQWETRKKGMCVYFWHITYAFRSVHMLAWTVTMFAQLCFLNVSSASSCLTFMWAHRDYNVCISKTVCVQWSYKKSVKICMCMCASVRQAKIFSVLSLLAAVGRQSQGAESHYRTSQLPPTRSDAVHSLSHTHAPANVYADACVWVQERLPACVVVCPKKNPVLIQI